MPSLRKNSQQIILYSEADSRNFPLNTNTCFKNNLHARLREESGLCPQVQLVGVYSTTTLSQIQIQLGGVKSYFFGSIHKGIHKRLHIGSGSVENHQYWQVKSASYFDLDLSNLDCWSVSILDQNGLLIPSERNASTLIELSIIMNPSAEAPKYLYFGSEPLVFPSFLKIKPTCYASLLSFSHQRLANIYPPHNEISIQENCMTGNEVNCINSSVLIPPDFYTLETLADILNSKILQYGISFGSKDGRLVIAKNRIGRTKLRISRKFAELIGCNVNHSEDFQLVGSESTFNLFNPLRTIPQVLTLKCSLLDKDSLNMVHQCLRLIYVNSNNTELSSYEFEHKQPCLMTSGYIDSIKFEMLTFPDCSAVHFAKNTQPQFSGCLNIEHIE